VRISPPDTPVAPETGSNLRLPTSQPETECDGFAAFREAHKSARLHQNLNAFVNLSQINRDNLTGVRGDR